MITSVFPRRFYMQEIFCSGAAGPGWQPVQGVLTVIRSFHIWIAPGEYIGTQIASQRRFAKFFKLHCNKLCVVLFRPLEGHHQRHRLIADEGENLHLLHCLVSAVHKFEQRNMAIHEQFQLPGIGVAIQRGSINHCIGFHHLLKEGRYVVLLDTAGLLQITLTHRTTKASIEMELGQRDHGHRFPFQGNR